MYKKKNCEGRAQKKIVSVTPKKFFIFSVMGRKRGRPRKSPLQPKKRQKKNEDPEYLPEEDDHFLNQMIDKYTGNILAVPKPTLKVKKNKITKQTISDKLEEKKYRERDRRVVQKENILEWFNTIRDFFLGLLLLPVRYIFFFFFVVLNHYF